MPVTLLPNRRYGRVELFLTAARDQDVGTFFYEELCRSQPYPGCATGNDCYFSLQLLIFGHRMWFSSLSALSCSLGRWTEVNSKVHHGMIRSSRSFVSCRLKLSCVSMQSAK